MSRLIETIKVYDNRLDNIFYHKQRVKNSCLKLYKSQESPICFSTIQKAIVNLDSGLYKLRIVYDKDNFEFTLHQYERRDINSLKRVYINNYKYDIKFEDRAVLTELYNQRENQDDILIIRNGYVTDSYYANVAFRKNKLWFTPEKPLLNGTKRQSLIDKGFLIPTRITEEDIMNYTSCRLYNAMIDFGEIEFDSSQIF